MREKFKAVKFRADTLAVINQANSIIAAYQAQGFKLTLRQLYYQFVARALIPNKQKEYKRLGSIIDNGRQAGHIDWDAIEDRTRNLERLSVWEDPEHILRWGWNTRHQTAQRVESLAGSHPGLPVVHLRSRREARAWLVGPVARVA